ncbi:hypothetical protein LCGC14_1172450 [marine sediment metagenome]|uniref:Uncharacterized protein n=1 Tax=marine sediment metagenome TaxID=412755 RepID=A0A0F9MCD1_9ZZZZ
MDRKSYNSCMSPHMKGTGLSKDERRMKMCVGAKLCTGKASTEKEAVALCNLPKEPKAGATPKKARGVNPCVRDVTARVASGELPQDTDVADVCKEVMDQVEEEPGIKVKIGNRKKMLSMDEFERICPCAIKEG